MIKKRGQVTIFIIIGILLVLVLGVIIVLKDTNNLKINQEIKEVNTFEVPIKIFVENCLTKSTLNGMEEVFAKGGYKDFPVNSNLFEFTNNDEVLTSPFYVFSENSLLPKLMEIEDNVAQSSQDKLIVCLEDFSQFEEQGLKIELEEPKINVNFATNTLVSLNLPLKISNDDVQKELSEFSVLIPFDFKSKYDGLDDFIDEQKSSENLLVGKLSTLSYENSADYKLTQFDDLGSDVLIDLYFDDVPESESLVYSFALSFPWEEKFVEPKEILSPTWGLNRIPIWNITKSGIEQLQINAFGDGIKYSIDPDSLSINENTGMITLNTADFPNDEYLYYVIIENSDGDSLSGPLEINVNVNQGNKPMIKPINQQKVNVNEKFTLQVEVENIDKSKILVYSTDSYLFDIDKKTGLMEYTPGLDDVGIHSIRVDVENEFGSTWQRWELVVG
jgi:hypothetical protein